MTTGPPPVWSVRLPPMLQRMPMKVMAVMIEESRPMAKSTTGSVAQRTSSAIRYSGLAGS